MSNRSHQGHTARKRFGQNFLVDEDVIDRIVRAIRPLPGQAVVEIGQGLAALTKPLRVCGNTFDMLAASRFAGHFDLLGDKGTHFGLFDCAPAVDPSSCATGSCC